MRRWSRSDARSWTATLGERVDEDDDRRRARKRERDDDRKDHRSDKKKKEKKAKKEHKRSHSHKKRDRDDDEAKGLPAGAPPISEADYFLRATEFRVWLARSKYAALYGLKRDMAVFVTLYSV